MDGAWLKITRARDQGRLLSDEIQAFLDDKPAELVADEDKQTRETVIRYHVLKEPPLMWGVQVGEIVHDLRSALDHIVYRLVIANDHTPTRTTGFPVFDDDVRYLQGRDKRPPGIRMIDGVHSDAAAIITELQPYQARKSGLDPHRMALCVLHEVWNADKHRVLHPATVMASVREIRLSTGMPLRGVKLTSHFPAHDGAEIARLNPQRPSPGGHMKVEADMTHKIVLDKPAPDAAREQDLVTTLVEMMRECRDVFARLSRFAGG